MYRLCSGVALTGPSTVDNKSIRSSTNLSRSVGDNFLKSAATSLLSLPSSVSKSIMFSFITILNPSRAIFCLASNRFLAALYLSEEGSKPKLTLSFSSTKISIACNWNAPVLYTKSLAFKAKGTKF